MQPLICAAFGALICADQRDAVSANQRFLLLGKIARVKVNHYPSFLEILFILSILLTGDLNKCASW